MVAGAVRSLPGLKATTDWPRSRTQGQDAGSVGYAGLETADLHPRLPGDGEVPGQNLEEGVHGPARVRHPVAAAQVAQGGPVRSRS